MKGLRLLPGSDGEIHKGEVFCCTFAPDGAFVLSGGWDGYLRLWDASSGGTVSALQVGPKAVSACAFSPDGKSWLSGSMEGLFTSWDPVSHQIRQNFVAHIRPISAICYSPDGKYLATASWDRQVIIRATSKEREGRTLSGHTDIVAGCRFTADGQQVVSWSHDATLRLWEAEFGRSVATLKGHKDRVVWASLSPDGRWAVSASRDGTLKLWDLQTKAAVAGTKLGELRACFFLLDGASVITADAEGGLRLLSVPALEVEAEFALGTAVLCGDLAPSGAVLALGGEDGRVHFVGVDGLQEVPLVVTGTPGARRVASVFGRLLGKPKVTMTYQYTCPACRSAGEVAGASAEAFPCPKCRRSLRLEVRSRQLQPQ
jgi:WD40 repeat protein